MLSRILELLRRLKTRVVIVYIVCFILILPFFVYSKFKSNAVEQTMSRLVPRTHYFKEFIYPKDHFDEYNLRLCINYHKRVAEFFPFQKAEAYGMLGFCYERLGNTDQSINYYQRSLEVVPYYFWPNYNLGIIYFKKGQYEKAFTNFKEALGKDLKTNMMLLSRSKVYNDVRVSDPGDYNFLTGLIQARQTTYIYLMQSLLKLGRYQDLYQSALLGLNEIGRAHV